MSASATDHSSSSISSSGHTDGLGRRSLFFDRETGEMLERVNLQPELAAFESLIKDRVTRLSGFDDERFARPARVERDPATGELTVLAEFITGSRLSDLLEATADAAIVPGVDVALGYLLEGLPALTQLHMKGGITHGLIDTSRTVLTPDGQIVFLDPVFGAAVERLNLSRTRLWTRFGIASPSGDGTVRLDAAADIAQVALGTVALVLGRNLRTDEYPDAFLGLLMEVIEVAQIRGTSSFATGLQRFLQRSLPIPGRRPYSTADEALFDIRQLVRRDIGADVCRQAVVDFAAQMDAAFPAAPAEDHGGASEAQGSSPSKSLSHIPRVPELHELLQGLDQLPMVTAGPSRDAADVAGDDTDETELSLELDVHSRALPATDRAGDNVEIYDLPPLDEFMAEATMLSPTSRVVETAHQGPRDAMTPAAADPRPWIADAPREPVMDAVLQEFIDSRSEWDLPPQTPEPVVDLSIPALVDSRSEWELPPQIPEPSTAPAAALPGPEPKRELAPTVAPPPEPPTTPLLQDVASVDAEPEPEPESEKDTPSSRRRKRQQQKSARARKDKLRSTTALKAPPPPIPQPEAPRPATPTGWLVSPQRAAAFEPPVPIPPPAPAPPPPPVRPTAAPAVPSFSPTPVGPLPQPVYPAAVSTSPYASRAVPSPPPAPVAPPPVPTAPPPAAPVKLKAEPPSGFTPKRSPYAEPQTLHAPTERFGTLGLGRPDSEVDNEPRAFPWKLAAIAVGVAIIAIILGQMYLPGRTAIPGEAGAPADASPAAAPTVPAEMAETPIPAGRGRLVIQTQPPGVKVMLDRRLVGETPLQLDVPPGRRILTFLTTGGEVIHSARVVAGKTEKVDLAVFNGWAAIFAPIVLDVAINGKKVGTTEQNRLLLPPGRHQLTLSNKDFGYSVTREAVIEPGEVFSISLDPRGTINLNAVPWAEVWLDGQKLGDTPLADLSIPLGLHEFVFKNPQYGERKLIATIKLNDNAPLAVDFSK